MKSLCARYCTLPTIAAFAVGCIVSLAIGYVTGAVQLPTKTTTYPIGTSYDQEVHVHADFSLYLGDERVRFTDAKYQSDTQHIHHPSLHFHDGNDEVIHRHADNVTLSDFFASIGMELTNDCLTMDTGIEHCTSDVGTLLLMVNGERIMDITKYITEEEDRILLYYGDATNPNIRAYVDDTTDLACMYSGTCPERGTPPTEGCGLTCEVSDFINNTQ